MLNAEQGSLWNALAAIVLCLFLAYSFLNLRFVWDICSVNVEGESMEDTIKDGALLYADRRKQPERGDIIIIEVKRYLDKYDFSDENIIKRLIGLEGDTIRITGGKVYRRLAGETEFVLLEEDYTKGDTYTRQDVFEMTVGEGEIFFLGDHRTNSTDSRVVGCFRLEDVMGVVTDWSFTEQPLSRWQVFFEWAKHLI